MSSRASSASEDVPNRPVRLPFSHAIPKLASLEACPRLWRQKRSAATLHHMTMVMPFALIWMLWGAWIQLSISSAQVDVPQVLTHRSTGALSAGGDPVGRSQSGTGRECCPPSSHLYSRTKHLTLFLSITKTSLAVPNSPTLCLSQQPVRIHLEYFVNKSSKMNHTKQQHPSTADAAHILNVLPAHESWSPPMGGTSDRLVSWIWEVDLLQHLVSGSQEAFHPSPCVCMTTWLSNGNATSSAAQYSPKEKTFYLLGQQEIFSARWHLPHNFTVLTHRCKRRTCSFPAAALPRFVFLHSQG